MKIKSTLKALNLGCGLTKFESSEDTEFINVDIDPKMNPDVLHDITKIPFPFDKNSIDVVYLLHTIEHLNNEIQIKVLNEIRRVLKDNGILVVSYPEFIKVAQNYIDNKNGNRYFWKATIYGRQLSPFDYHVSLMDTRYFVQLLNALKFDVVTTRPEHKQVFNTLVIARKSNALLTREQVINDEIFGGNDGSARAD